MKKTYTSPTVEKIRFNYRDQVVAASGMLNSSGPEQPPENPTLGEQIKDYLFQAGGWSGCDAYECRSLANLG